MKTMTIEEVKTQTQDVVLELIPDLSRDELGDESDIFSLGLDSINAMNLVFSLQDAFDITFDVEEINVDNFRTVADITELVKNKK